MRARDARLPRGRIRHRCHGVRAGRPAARARRARAVRIAQRAGRRHGDLSRRAADGGIVIAPLRDDERGSVLPLVAGYAALGLAVTLVAINALSLFVAQKRVDALADAAALAASDGFEIVAGDAGPSIRLDPATAARQAQEVLDVAPGDAVLVGVDTASES